MVRWCGEPVRVADATVLTIGVFDGLHVGHQALIGETVASARGQGLLAACLTFFPSPDVVLRGQEPRYLLPLTERVELMSALGLDLIIVTKFGPEMAAMGAAEFMQRLGYSFRPRQVWVGEDFALGRQREGNLEALATIGRELGYELCVVPRCRVGDEVVSSTLVRRYLAEGRVARVAELLGRAYTVSGPVVPGAGRGRSLGYPTANVAVDQHKLLPADGVYCARLEWNGRSAPAVVNIGVRPTFEGSARTVEAHALDFGGDLYGERLTVAFLERLRGETRFPGAHELVAQLARDVEEARRVLEVGAAAEARRGV
ncbi:MAG: bifunctional riboflavin kinase/FAD synthetase [Anaerolineae bacterium]|nr:bifunctional riboflavin kinase/FAD synthetase [Anaerolineae bacterium]